MVVYLSFGCKDDKLIDHNNDFAKEIYSDDYQENPFKWGYIDRQGEIAVKAIYEDNRDFPERLAATNYKGLWGYINKRGETIINFQ